MAAAAALADTSDDLVKRAYSLLTVKAVDEDERVIRGIATTPETDRIGDIVEPMGIKFHNPMPLLLHHRHDQPVGKATFDRPTDKGISFEARIAKMAEPGALKDRLDEAWQSIKAGLIAGVSIGFRALELEPLKDGGLRFTRSEVYELSLVTIPANASAQISVIKSIDAELMAASGQSTQATPAVVSRSGASETKPVTLKLKERSSMTTVDERIKALEAKRAANLARMNAISEEAGKLGETPDAEKSEEYDDLERELETVDKQLERERKLEKLNLAKATPVNQVKTVDDGAAARGGNVRITSPKAAPGIRFARVAKCIGMARGNLGDASRIAESLYSDDLPIQSILKAAVSAGNTSDATWAGPLVSDEGAVFADFVEFLRPMTILGKFGTNGIPSLRRVPFRVPLGSQTTGGTGYWVGEGRAKPLTRFDFARTTLEPLKVANIAVVTEELLRDASTSAEMLIRDGLAGALRELMDTDFINPGKTASAGISPASITSTASPVTSSGVDGDAVRADIAAVMQGFINADNPPTNGVWIMAASTALSLSLMQNALGQPEYPGVTMNGGTFAGLPVIVSEYVPTSGGSPNTRYVFLVNASDVYLADEGGIMIDMSREASLQMDNAPTMNTHELGSPSAPTATSVVSLWQTNSVGFRAERTINWALRRASAVQAIEGVVWGT